MRLFKSITARELFRQFPELRKELWGGEFWADGYYLATVGTTAIALKGWLPAWLAMWVPNVIAGIVAIFLNYKLART